MKKNVVYKANDKKPIIVICKGNTQKSFMETNIIFVLKEAIARCNLKIIRLYQEDFDNESKDNEDEISELEEEKKLYKFFIDEVETFIKNHS